MHSFSESSGSNSIMGTLDFTYFNRAGTSNHSSSTARLTLGIRASTREMSAALTCANFWDNSLTNNCQRSSPGQPAINQARPSAWSSPYLPSLPLQVSSPKEYNRRTTISSYPGPSSFADHLKSQH
jgi:hypothetical protein